MHETRSRESAEFHGENILNDGMVRNSGSSKYDTNNPVGGLLPRENLSLSFNNYVSANSLALIQLIKQVLLTLYLYMKDNDELYEF